MWEWKKTWPLWCALSLAAIGFIALLLTAYVNNDQHFTYALDDPYIHMAIARNLVQDGVWGVSRHHFSSAASSLIWPLLIALCFLVGGVNEFVPLFLNVVVTVALLLFLYYLMQRHTGNRWVICFFLLAIIFVTPLLPLIFSGLEHILYILLLLMFAYYAAAKLAGDVPLKLKEHWPLLILAPLITLTRYEGLFLLAVSGALFLLRRRFAIAFLMCGLGMLPILIFGLLAISQGEYFFPNAVMLKGTKLSFESWADISSRLNFAKTFLLLRDKTEFIALLIGVLCCLYLLDKDQREEARKYKYFNIMFIITTYLHCQFASLKGFFRYEAYLVAWGLTAIFLSGVYLTRQDEFKSRGRQIAGRILIVLLLLFPFSQVGLTALVSRGLDALRYTPRAMENIYNQQYQMGQFIKEYYPSRGIVLNDIGVANFYNDIRYFDITGIGDVGVLNLRRNNNFNPQSIAALARARSMEIALIYDEWANNFGGVPKEWVKVGQWTLRKNYVCGSDTVSFYAINPNEKDRLAACFKAYAPRLSFEVISEGPYMK